MKKILKILSILTILGTLLISCAQQDKQLSEQELTAVGTDFVNAQAKAIAIATQFTRVGPSFKSDVTDRSSRLSDIKDNIINDINENTCLDIDIDPISFTLTAEFDESCEIQKLGIKVSGKISITAKLESGALYTVLTFENFTVDNFQTISGSIKISIDSIGVFDIESSLTIDQTQISLNGTASINGSSVILDGAGAYMADNFDVSIDVDNVVWVFPDCYPSDGKITVSLNDSIQSIEFDSNTPLTGDVEVTIGDTVTTITLDTYVGCIG